MISHHPSVVKKYFYLFLLLNFIHPDDEDKKEAP